MNLFYESYPEMVEVHGKNIRIVTDFRDYIKLQDALSDDSVSEFEQYMIICDFFLDDCAVEEEAIHALTDFLTMSIVDQAGITKSKDDHKPLFSFSVDFPYILSAFISVYGINLQTIKYMHWWKFKTLFDGLPDNTEIKQRIMYRGIDLSTIKDKEERKRIRRIQNAIRLPNKRVLSDYEIGDVFSK